MKTVPRYSGRISVILQTLIRTDGCDHQMIGLITQLGGDLASTRVAELEVHAERVVTLVKQSL